MKPFTAFGLASLLMLGCGATKAPDGETFGSGGRPDDAATGFQGSEAGGDFNLGEPTDAGGGATDGACAAAKEEAKLVPLDIFIMQDQSGSMKDKTSTGATKWEAVKSALSAFMSDPASNGIGVGIQFFPLADPSGGILGSGSSCKRTDYQKAEVEIAALPAVQPAIESALAAHVPTGGTPTGPALQGALTHANEWRVAHPSHVVVVLLATDGQPTLCTPSDIPSIAADATAAAKAGIRSYVIGVLADADISSGADTNLNDISKAGNGGPAFIVKSGSADVTKAFLDAMKKIRGAALGCEYSVPTGAGANYKKVNVKTTIGGAPSFVPYVGSAAACDPVKGGWYYDVDPTTGTPKKILLCGGTCGPLQADSGAKIEIEVGCETIGIK